MRKEWFDKAEELRQQGHIDEAIEYYDKIIEAKMDGNGWAHHLKGCSLIELDRYEEAVDVIQRACQLDPDSDYKFDLGRALYELGRYSEARVAFQTVAKRSFVFGVDKKAQEWLARLDQEGRSDSTPEAIVQPTGAAGASGFSFEVADVFTIKGKGLVASGQVTSGCITPGEVVEVMSSPEPMRVKVIALQMFAKHLDKASAGDQAGLLLEGISDPITADQVKRGTIIRSGE